MTGEILTIFLLLLLNSFFALSEMAIVSANKPVLRQMERKGNRRAGIALRLAEDPGRFLSTVQVGITLVGILAGAFGGATLAEKLADSFNALPYIAPRGETVAFTLVVSIITYFSVLIGELVPKQFALSNPEKLAIFVAPVMTVLSRLCTPVVYLLEASADFIMRILGIIKKTDDRVTEAEVKAVLSSGAESGVIEPSEHDMLQRIIRLGDRDVKSIMTHRMDIVSLDIDDNPEKIKEKIASSRHSRYPVTDGSIDNIIGVVQTKELLNSFISADRAGIRHHIQEIILIPETTHCLEALELFKKTNMHLALVVDEYGTTQGIITDSDMLEAIIGTLPSNYDRHDHALVSKRDDGSWLVDGMTPIDEIHLIIGLDDIKTNSDYDTIAGFILHDLGTIPYEGQNFEKFGYYFEVIDMDGHRIDKIIVRKTDSQE